jgi:hypothetical protein
MKKTLIKVVSTQKIGQPSTGPKCSTIASKTRSMNVFIKRNTKGESVLSVESFILSGGGKVPVNVSANALVLITKFSLENEWRCSNTQLTHEMAK